MMKGKILLEWFFWILLSVLLFTAGIEIAFLSPVIILAAPVPMMILTCKMGSRTGSLGALCGTGLVYMTMGPVSAFMYTCEFGLLGLLMGVLVIKIKSGVDYMLAAIAVSLLVKIFLMAVFSRAVGVNPFLITPESATELLGSMSHVLTRGGVAVSQQTIKEYAEAMVSTVTLMMPSMLILFAAIDSITAYALTRLYFKRAGGFKLPSLPPFGYWRFPKNIFWALLAALVLDMASKAFPDEYLYRMLSVNLMEVLRGVFLIEGLSLLWYFMTARRAPKAVKTTLVLVCALFAPVSYILSMIGIFDIWYDLRKRIKLRRK
ncbi:MAG: DUF2232 domain-containing protein [Cloacibacillus sp.]